MSTTINIYPQIIPSAPPEEMPYKQVNMPINPQAPAYNQAPLPDSPAPSYNYAVIGERTSRLVEMSTEVANSILPDYARNAKFESNKVPPYVKPQNNGNSSSWFSWMPTVLNIDMSKREYSFFSSKTVNQQAPAPARSKTKEEIVQEKEDKENTERAVKGTAGVVILLGALYMIGRTMRDNLALLTNISEYKECISAWNKDRMFYLHNDNVLINNIVGKVCAIYERQRVDGIFKLVCFTLGALSGGSLLTGALYNVRELYRVAVILGVIASSVGILRYSFRRNDPRDIEDAKYIQREISNYNIYSGK